MNYSPCFKGEFLNNYTVVNWEDVTYNHNSEIESLYLIYSWCKLSKPRWVLSPVPKFSVTVLTLISQLREQLHNTTSNSPSPSPVSAIYRLPRLPQQTFLVTFIRNSTLPPTPINPLQGRVYVPSSNSHHEDQKFWSSKGPHHWRDFPRSTTEHHSSFHPQTRAFQPVSRVGISDPWISYSTRTTRAGSSYSSWQSRTSDDPSSKWFSELSRQQPTWTSRSESTCTRDHSFTRTHSKHEPSTGRDRVHFKKPASIHRMYLPR